MVRYADKYDPDLAAAFEKLERGLPSPLGRARRTDARRPVQGAARRALQRECPAADPGLGRAAGRDHRLRAGQLRAGRDAAAGDGPAVPARTVAPDARALPDRVRRGARGDPDVQDRADPDRRADAAARSSRPTPAATTSALRAAWDIIADQPPVEVVLRFVPACRRRVREATWHPTQSLETEADGSLRWRATGLGHDRDPALDPAVGRRRGGRRAGGAARRRGRHAPGAPLARYG